MKKRSKKRIPQDLLPWKRIKEVTDSEDDSFKMFVPSKTTRWTVGTRRNREATLLYNQDMVEYRKLLLKSVMFDQIPFDVDQQQDPIPNDTEALRRSMIQYKLSKLHRMSETSRSKNTCLFTGKGSTFNRKLFISRQTLRKLMRFGLIGGLKKNH